MSASQRSRISCICLYCGKLFEVIPARIRRGGGKYCSYSCLNAGNDNRTGIILDRSRPSIVYEVTNLVNGKRYVGVTSMTLEHRKASHIRAAKAGAPNLLARAIRKYGNENFQFIKVKDCLTFSEALEDEKHLIAALQPEYNLTEGGEGCLGRIPTPETLAKRRQKPSPLKGIPRPADVVEKMRVALKGRKLIQTPERKEQLRAAAAAMRARPRRGYATQRQRKHLNRLHSARQRPVICLNDGFEFPSAMVAERHYGIYAGAVSAVATGVRPAVFGYVFRYKDSP